MYCDLIEHAILHVLIAIESSFKYGFPGYADYIRPNIKEWYLDKKIPNFNWEKNCYNKAYLEPEEAFEILDKMNRILKGRLSKYSSDETEDYEKFSESLNEPETLAEYYDKKQQNEEKTKARIKKRVKQTMHERNTLIESLKDLTNKSSRLDILKAAYYINHYYPAIIANDELFFRAYSSVLTFEEFDKKMKEYIKDDILKKLKEDISKEFNKS